MTMFVKIKLRVKIFNILNKICIIFSLIKTQSKKTSSDINHPCLYVHDTL